MDFYDGTRYIHIASGTVALATFWTAAFLRKGSSRHRLVGRTYMLAMILILVTAVPLALGAFARGKPIFGTFLLYLLVITGSPTWLAWRAIRDKHSVQRFTGPTYHALAWLNIIAGAVVLYFGVRFGSFLLTGFSAVGIVTGVMMIRYTRKPPTDRLWYLSRHYGSIIACGVATHVAFVNLGLSRLVAPEWNRVVLNASFFGPLAVALLARMWLDRQYGGKHTSLSARSSVAVNYAIAESRPAALSAACERRDFRCAYAPPATAALKNGRLACSSFDNSRDAFAKATVNTTCSMAPTPTSRPAAQSLSPGAVAPENPHS
jgi:hypothetical protein